MTKEEFLTLFFSQINKNSIDYFVYGEYRNLPKSTANVITDNCGIKIRVDNKRQIVCDFAKAIDRLNKDRCLLKLLSEGAIKRAEENSWESKSEILCKIYENAVAGGAK